MKIDIEPLINKVEKIKMKFRILILVGTLLLLAGSFAYLFYLPNADKISRLKKDISNLENRIRIARVKSRRLGKLEAKFKEVNIKFKEALTLLPEKKEIPSLLTRINQLGRESNLEFLAFKPKKEVKKDFYVEIPVSMKVKGRYHNIAMFFYRVGKMKRIVNIMNINMKPSKSLSPELISNCEAVTYRFEPKKKGK